MMWPLKEGRSFSFGRVFSLILTLLVSLLAFVSVLSFFGRLNLWFDLFSHFRLQYAVVFVLCCAIFAALKRSRLAIFAGLLVLLNGIPVAALWIPNSGRGGRPAEPCRLSLMNLNLQYGNTECNAVDGVIARFDPDIVTFQELSPMMYAHLQKSLRSYPHSFATPRNDPYGIGIFSKKRFVATDANPLELPINLAMRADIDLEGHRITILSAHVCGPTSKAGYDLDMDLVRALRKFCEQRPNQPIVMVGDFNCTPWSHLFRRLKKAGDFLDSERGVGLQCSWPAFNNFAWLSIPIDHCFYSHGLLCLERVLGPIVGSDHRPLFLRLGLAQK
jgi:endonuclease/exonuclease/phosphatase (EEP) superfamily protein YafD